MPQKSIFITVPPKLCKKPGRKEFHMEFQCMVLLWRIRAHILDCFIQNDPNNSDTFTQKDKSLRLTVKTAKFQSKHFVEILGL